MAVSEGNRVLSALGIGLAVVAFASSGVWVSEYRTDRDQTRDEAQQELVDSTLSSAARVDQLLVSMENAAKSIAEDVSRGAFDADLSDRFAEVAFDEDGDRLADQRACRPTADTVESALESALCARAALIPELNGLGIVFDADDEVGYAPYANRISGRLGLRQLNADEDLRVRDWYLTAVERESAGWIEPSFGQTSQKLLALYSVPVYNDDDRSLRAVVLLSYALDNLADDLRGLTVGSTGYSIIRSNQGGRLVSHPSAARVERDFAPGSPRPQVGLVATLRDAVQPDGGARDAVVSEDGGRLLTGLTDDVTESSAWLAWTEIPSADWTYAAVALESEVFHRTADQNRLLMNAGLAVVGGLFFLAVGIFGLGKPTDTRVWILSSTAAILALVGVGLIWSLTLNGPRDVGLQEDQAVGTGDDAAAGVPPPDSTLGDTAGGFDLGGEGAADAGEARLFGGVFVQSVEFTGSNDVTVSGIAWQEQRSDQVGVEPPGFVLPEADSATFEEQYRLTNGNLTRIGWSFTASLRQSFDYSRYPLDRETVWLRLWPADYRPSLTIIPDLSSYETLAPSSTPGIEDEFVVEGWVLEASSYSFRNNSYNTEFGPDPVAGTPTSELYFNVHLQRSFLDALLSQLVPLSVVAVLLFSVLFIFSRTSGTDNPIDPVAVLGYCAALFFVVILSQTDLRSKLNAENVVYLDYFYFVSYLAILAVSGTAIASGSNYRGRIVRARGHMAPAMLFWPFFNTTLLGITIAAFY